MTPFETIILIMLYLFAVGYMIPTFGFANEHNTWIDRLFIIIGSLTLGVIYFPAILAIDIWTKLNNNKMNKESKLNLNASDYAISHCESGKTYNGLEVHKMLCDAYIAGSKDDKK